ncbi:MAG: imidazoleglycerol-phosphate dehydratase [Methanotrichaceae archaeon]
MRSSKTDAEYLGARARVEINLDGDGAVELDTESAFLDHMLHAFARMSWIDLKASAEGEISYQRARALGQALGSALDLALRDKKGIRRYGWAAVPMDESLAQVALDISGRPYLVMKGTFKDDLIGDLEAQHVKTVIESATEEAHLTLNIRFEGENDHHKAESLFKALGLALKEAKIVEGTKVPSTKGVL